MAVGAQSQDVFAAQGVSWARALWSALTCHLVLVQSEVLIETVREVSAPSVLSQGSHVLILTNQAQHLGTPRHFQESHSVPAALCPAEFGAAQLWTS